LENLLIVLCVARALTDSKELFERFVTNLWNAFHPGEGMPGYRLPDDPEEASQVMAQLLHKISQFFYAQSPRTKGEESLEETSYFSDFHKFWEENCEQVLGFRVDEERCRQVAERLEAYYRPYDFAELVDTHGLSKEEIANVRLFVTVQDFGVGFKSDYYELARRRPELFDARTILENPDHIDEVARHLGVADYQPDKRLVWAERLANLLVDSYEGSAYTIGPKHDYDAVKIRTILADRRRKLGLATKKVDMFLRDMQRLGVWELQNFEQVGVASDMNTMRVALRTGIVWTRIPLLSSFLDVYSRQYSAMDLTAQKAWRRVWEIWKEMPDNHCVPSPADMDYAIYRLGQHCCKTNRRHCDTKRQLEVLLMTPESYPLNQMLQGKCTKFCVFTGICDDDNTNPERKKLNPPKSISIYGRYGWTRSTSNEGGGLGLRA
jgi:hypothetical protein